MSTIIEFPSDNSAPPEDDEETRHAEAFRELEGRLSDCVTMAQIATQMMMDAASINNEGVAFAVCHVSEMLIKLKKDYYAAWDGKGPGGLHTSSI